MKAPNEYIEAINKQIAKIKTLPDSVEKLKETIQLQKLFIQFQSQCISAFMKWRNRMEAITASCNEFFITQEMHTAITSNDPEIRRQGRQVFINQLDLKDEGKSPIVLELLECYHWTVHDIFHYMRRAEKHDDLLGLYMDAVNGWFGDQLNGKEDDDERDFQE